MRRGVIVGTAGHVDHGKTSLVRALTGIETDRWAEEQERGLTIDIGFAPIEAIAGVDTGIVDVPGHEDFVKNMLAGSTGVDVMLLVVAADEGPMPQTREHLTIARVLGIQKGVVAMNKVDRVDDDWLDLARDTTREEVARILGHGDWPLVDVSATTGKGLPELREAIGTAAAGCVERDGDDLFRMPVDRSFSVRGAGTVVTGTTWSGQAGAGDRVRVLPCDITARVRSLQVHGEERPTVGPARRCALALVGVDASQVERGSVIVGPGRWRLLDRLGARMEVPAESPRHVEHGQRVRLFLGTGEVMARVRTVDREPVSRGRTGWVVLECERPVVARAGDRFVLRFFSPVTTVGGGRVCSLDPPRGWRAQLDHWAAILDGSEGESVAAAVGIAGGRGIAGDELPLVSRVSAGSVESVLEQVPSVVRIGGSWFHRAVAEQAERAVVEHLHTAHQERRRASAEPLESVRAALSSRYAPELIDRAVETLSGEGRVVVRGPGIRLTGHEAGLSDQEQDALDRLTAILSSANLSPPPPADLARQVGVTRDVLNDLTKLLVERGEVIRVTPEIFLTREAVAEARTTIRRIAGSRPVGPGEFREALAVTRKYLIPLLEYMDRVGETRRVPEGRVSTAPE